jgi:hypothetical protein
MRIRRNTITAHAEESDEQHVCQNGATAQPWQSWGMTARYLAIRLGLTLLTVLLVWLVWVVTGCS